MKVNYLVVLSMIWCCTGNCFGFNGNRHNATSTNPQDSIFLNCTQLFQELQQLIENFTYVIHLPEDGLLLQEIVNDFQSVLSQYSLQSSRITGSSSDSGLIHHALYGVFKNRYKVIKENLATQGHKTIHKNQFDMLAPWNVKLLEIILKSNVANVNSVGEFDLTPLELSVKLQLISSMQLIVANGGSICSFDPSLKCTTAFHYAVINSDIPAVEFLILALKEQVLKHDIDLTNIICFVLFQQHPSMPYSVMDIAYWHCAVGLTCHMYEYLQTMLKPYIFECMHTTSPIPKLLQSLHESTCSTKERYFNNYHCNRVSLKQIMNSNSEINRFMYKWRVYNDLPFGSIGCELPRIKAQDIDDEFEHLFVNLSIPVVIEGMTKGWRLFKEWEKDTLQVKWGHLDVLAGPIPYGNVFGEKFGFATIAEFLSYMDEYAKQPLLSPSLNHTKAPLYVFDSEVLQSHFGEDYSIEALSSLSIWKSAITIHQFILGPVGSGAPFHFHCNAANALIYGQKRWFLYPPGHSMYSKVHPLWWDAKYSSLSATDKPIECIQKAGEVLFVPSQWAHSTLNLDECIGLAVEFDTGNC